MSFQISPAPHLSLADSAARVMWRVLYAMLPGVVALFWFFGWGVLIQIVLASVTALITEAIMLKLRDKPLQPFITDGSVLVTAWLLAVSIPPLAPWWVIMTGTGFAVIIAKHLYGGLGYNPFNPAMVGYAVLLISFPLEMTAWQLPYQLIQVKPDLFETIHIIIGSSGVSVDGLTGATPLDTLKTQRGQGYWVNEITVAPLFGYVAGVGWESVSIAFLAGGLWLIYTRTADWRIPLAMLLALVIVATLFYLYDSQRYASPQLHLVGGATLLGAFFIATDPVSASTTPLGRLIYGAGIGILTYFIRVFGGYPDAIAFAVLLMNLSAPTIDYYTQPRVFGK